MKRSKKILICPLDWGLGHATRCIPVIRELVKQDHVVVIGGTGMSLTLLKDEFPGLRTVSIPGYPMKYAGRKYLFPLLLLQMPLFIISVYREYIKLKRIQKKEKFDLIISDNRYGLFNKNCMTVFITHQVNIILPPYLKIFQPLSRAGIRFFIRKFDICWIPDRPGEKNLSGILSRAGRKLHQVRFTGILSRYLDFHDKSFPAEDYDIVAIVSGPEPSRKRFEKTLRKQMILSGQKSLLVKGLPGPCHVFTEGCFTEVSHMNSLELAGVIQNAKYLVCRSGYSGVMDLVALGKKAMLVPTPGQTEQEYLAVYLKEKGLFPCMVEESFNLEQAKNELDSFSNNLSGWSDTQALTIAIEEVLGLCKDTES